MAFSISHIKRPALRRTALIASTPVGLPLLLIIGAAMGAQEAWADFRIAWRNAWRGRS